MRDRSYRRRHQNHNNGLAGLVLLGVGVVWLVRQMGVDIPNWMFSWPMILIVVGLFVGMKNNFQDLSWVILMGVGSYFLLDRWFPEWPIRPYLLPLIVIGAGLFMVLSPRRRHYGARMKWQEEDPVMPAEPVSPDENSATGATAYEQGSKPDELNIVSVFAGIKKRVFSREFQGGNVVCIFGGADVDLTHADFKGPIYIDLFHMFGGSKLIIPPHWEVRTDAVVVFGGIDDKRKASQLVTDPNKLVILKGAIIFGGVEIKSY